MKVAVLVKQTFTTEARIVLDGAGGIDGSKVKKIVNPYDEFAVEEAVQLKEKGAVESISVFCVGPESAAEALRQCLAMGADEATLIDDAGIDGVDASQPAAVLAAAIREGGFDLLLAGYVAVDDNAAQTAVRVAEILGIPQINVVSKLELGRGEVTAWREADGVTEVVTAPLPALVTADKSLNRPRYPTLPNIMKAKKKPLVTKTPADYGITVEAPKVKTVQVSLPPPKTGAKILDGTPAESAKALVRALRDEAKVV